MLFEIPYYALEQCSNVLPITVQRETFTKGKFDESSLQQLDERNFNELLDISLLLNIIKALIWLY